MNKETKLRIHNITAKAALKFGSEAWVLKKREEQRLEATQMKFLRHFLGIIKLDKKTNLYPFSVHVVTFTFHYQLMHLLIKTLSQFTSRRHTDRYIASIHIQTTYRHKLECDEAGRQTRSHCVRYGN